MIWMIIAPLAWFALFLFNSVVLYRFNAVHDFWEHEADTFALIVAPFETIIDIFLIIFYFACLFFDTINEYQRKIRDGE